MSVLGLLRAALPPLAGRWRWIAVAVLAGTLGSGCDHPFRPFQENPDAVFSMFGYLDLKADTQWVRVMPIRQNLLLAPEPIDATVTLEHLGSGRIVTLRDSLFQFTDRQLDGVAYAYNFWTSERLEPGASYRLKAVRSDGATTTATVVMPGDLVFSFLSGPGIGSNKGLLRVQAERVLFVDVFYTMRTAAGDPAPSLVIRADPSFSTGDPGTQIIAITTYEQDVPGFEDMRRHEFRIAVAGSDWPYHPGLSDLEVALPGRIPSNVENGVGFVGGTASWMLPFHRCEVLEARPGADAYCATIFNGESATIAGRLIREGCGAPHALKDVRLRERFAGGGAVIRTWRTGWDGNYRFEGIEPGSELVLEPGGGSPAVPLPRLGPRERFTVDDIAVPVDCMIP